MPKVSPQRKLWVSMGSDPERRRRGTCIRVRHGVRKSDPLRIRNHEFQLALSKSAAPLALGFAPKSAPTACAVG